ncbi:MAG: hypothetical protein GXX96_16940 [Planctomycetaceae bacterium]|nr:hypothetical protein [Planctomycetaceae bacterium]
MTKHSAVKPAGLGAILVIAAAVFVAAWTVWKVDRSGKNGNTLPDEFNYQIEQYKKIDPALIAYRDVLVFPANMESVKAVAVGPADRIHVAGDRAIRIFDPKGVELQTIELEGPPSCIAVAPPGHIREGYVFVGIGDHVELFDSGGNRTAVWPSLGARAVLTSIAVAEADVFVADAGQSRVHRLNPDGEVLGAIGDYADKNNQAAFAVPSPFFDVAVHPDGWLRVVNSGALRVEAYSFDGKLQLFWGKGGAEIDRFFGCCNPANLAVLPDGRYVTAEKGLVRVKIYSADGHFESVVAGPETFGANAASANESLSDHEYTAVDVAIDGKQRVIVLDLTTAQVHVFEPNQAAADGESEE